MQNEFISVIYFGWLFVSAFVGPRHLHLAGEPERLHSGRLPSFQVGKLEVASTAMTPVILLRIELNVFPRALGRAFR